MGFLGCNRVLVTAGVGTLHGGEAVAVIFASVVLELGRGEDVDTVDALFSSGAVAVIPAGDMLRLGFNDDIVTVRALDSGQTVVVVGTGLMVGLGFHGVLVAVDALHSSGAVAVVGTGSMGGVGFHSILLTVDALHGSGAVAVVGASLMGVLGFHGVLVAVGALHGSGAVAVVGTGLMGVLGFHGVLAAAGVGTLHGGEAVAVIGAGVGLGGGADVGAVLAGHCGGAVVVVSVGDMGNHCHVLGVGVAAAGSGAGEGLHAHSGAGGIGGDHTGVIAVAQSGYGGVGVAVTADGAGVQGIAVGGTGGSDNLFRIIMGAVEGDDHVAAVSVAHQGVDAVLQREGGVGGGDTGDGGIRAGEGEGAAVGDVADHVVAAGLIGHGQGAVDLDGGLSHAGDGDLVLIPVVVVRGAQALVGAGAKGIVHIGGAFGDTGQQAHHGNGGDVHLGQGLAALGHLVQGHLGIAGGGGVVGEGTLAGQHLIGGGAAVVGGEDIAVAHQGAVHHQLGTGQSRAGALGGGGELDGLGAGGIGIVGPVFELIEVEGRAGVDLQSGVLLDGDLRAGQKLEVLGDVRIAVDHIAAGVGALDGDGHTVGQAHDIIAGIQRISIDLQIDTDGGAVAVQVVVDPVSSRVILADHIAAVGDPEQAAAADDLGAGFFDHRADHDAGTDGRMGAADRAGIHTVFRLDVLDEILVDGKAVVIIHPVAGGGTAAPVTDLEEFVNDGAGGSVDAAGAGDIAEGHKSTVDGDLGIGAVELHLAELTGDEAGIARAGSCLHGVDAHGALNDQLGVIGDRQDPVGGGSSGAGFLGVPGAGAGGGEEAGIAGLVGHQEIIAAGQRQGAGAVGSPQGAVDLQQDGLTGFRGGDCLVKIAVVGAGLSDDGVDRRTGCIEHGVDGITGIGAGIGIGLAGRDDAAGIGAVPAIEGVVGGGGRRQRVGVGSGVGRAVGRGADGDGVLAGIGHGIAAVLARAEGHRYIGLLELNAGDGDGGVGGTRALRRGKADGDAAALFQPVGGIGARGGGNGTAIGHRADGVGQLDVINGAVVGDGQGRSIRVVSKEPPAFGSDLDGVGAVVHRRIGAGNRNVKVLLVGQGEARAVRRQDRQGQHGGGQQKHQEHSGQPLVEAERRMIMDTHLWSSFHIAQMQRIAPKDKMPPRKRGLSDS